MLQVSQSQTFSERKSDDKIEEGKGKDKKILQEK